MLGNLGSPEILVIGIVLLMLFGSKKLNELARGLGESSKEYKKLKNEYQKALNDDPDVEEQSTSEDSVTLKSERSPTRRVSDPEG